MKNMTAGKKVGIVCILLAAVVVLIYVFTVFGNAKQGAWSEAIDFLTYLQSPESDYAQRHNVLTFDSTYREDRVEKLSNSYLCNVDGVLNGNKCTFRVEVHQKFYGEWEVVDMYEKY